MIIRLLIDGLLSLGRPVSVASLRIQPPEPRPQARRGEPNRRRQPRESFRGRPDLLLMTGALKAPPPIPHRAVRGRSVSLPGRSG